MYSRHIDSCQYPLISKIDIRAPTSFEIPYLPLGCKTILDLRNIPNNSSYQSLYEPYQSISYKMFHLSF